MGRKSFFLKNNFSSFTVPSNKKLKKYFCKKLVFFPTKYYLRIEKIYDLKYQKFN